MRKQLAAVDTTVPIRLITTVCGELVANLIGALPRSTVIKDTGKVCAPEVIIEVARAAGASQPFGAKTLKPKGSRTPSTATRRTSPRSSRATAHRREESPSGTPPHATNICYMHTRTHIVSAHTHATHVSTHEPRTTNHDP